MKVVLLAAVLSLVAACGTEREVEVANDTGQGDSTATPAPGAAPATGFAAIQPVLNTYCVPCHQNAPYLKGEAAFRASDAQRRTASLNMPPPASIQAKNLSAADRKKITSF